MPAPDEHLALAWRAIRSADAVHSSLRRGDLVTAQGHAIVLNGQVRRVLDWLEVALADAAPVPDSSGNPHSGWAPPFAATDDDWLTGLSDEQLREYCRGVDWDRRSATGMAGWGYSKLLSAAERELHRRGLGAESWQEGGEVD